MSAMKRLFQIMAEKKASDIFISVGSPINIKINGMAMPVNQTVMTADTVKQLLYDILTETIEQCRVRALELENRLAAWDCAGAAATAAANSAGPGAEPAERVQMSRGEPQR